MTNEDLDAACCRFAEIEPEHEYHEIGCFPDIDKCTCKALILYPPVSTSWEWAGKLMDALGEKAIVVMMGFQDGQYTFTVGPRWTSETRRGYNPCGPMALAMAVSKLANSDSNRGAR